MKIVVQRVKNAQVDVDNKIVGKINQGFLVFLGLLNIFQINKLFSYIFFKYF